MYGLRVLSLLLTHQFIIINSESVCEEKYSTKQFVITSKNYPNAYPVNFSCNYLIESDSCPRKYNFQFLDFDLENDEECLTDYLKVNGERLCGLKSGVKTYFASNGSLHVKFVTNEVVSGRGFKILVTRLSCENVEQKQNFYNYNPATQIAPFCCKQAYKAKHFYLTSPGFPYTHSQTSDCVYHVYKTNQNICRLRIHAIYFLHGSLNETCSRNFLEIDGKKLCGCQTDLKIITPFNHNSNAPKILRFKNDGFHNIENGGFALEVFQDECPWRRRLEKRSVASIENAKLLFANYQQDQQENIVKHVFFFSDPQELSYVPDVKKRKDREEVDFVDTSDVNFRLNGNAGEQCVRFDFGQLVYNSLWSEALQCKIVGNEPPRDCKELRDVRGYFYSPGYPYYYPNNLNLCYRFTKQSGYCSVKFLITDFQIEYSKDCRKDYLLLGGKFRYCGQQLHNTVSTLDLSRANYEDVIFVTDSYYCDRGFKGIYEQIPCLYEYSTTLAPPVTQTPVLPCNSLISQQYFMLNIFAEHQDTCVFTITKNTTEVCRLELQSLASNLDCNSEDVFVKGRSLCSLTESETFSTDFRDDDSIPIVYKRFITHPGVSSGLRIQLSGKQSSENCFYNIPEVPAEKLVTASSNYGLFLVLNSSIDDFCTIIANINFEESPQESCKILMQTNLVEKCITTQTNGTDLPSNIEKLQMFLLPQGRRKNVAVQKIDCNNLTVSN